MERRRRRKEERSKGDCVISGGCLILTFLRLLFPARELPSIKGHHDSSSRHGSSEDTGGWVEKSSKKSHMPHEL